MTRNRITRSPTLHFRQTLLQLSRSPNATKAAQYEQIISNWANKTLYTDPSDKVTDIDHLELYNCVCAIAHSYLCIQSFLQNKAKVIVWINDLLTVIEKYDCPYKNNILISGYLAKIMCAYILGRNLDTYAYELNEFLAKNVSFAGFVLCESRENATITYHTRFMIMFLLTQCFLYQAGSQVICPWNQKLLQKVLERLSAVIGTSDIPPGSFYHDFTKWNGNMTCISKADYDRIQAMFGYTFGNHDITQLPAKDVRWWWSALTLGDIELILKAMNSSTNAPCICMPFLQRKSPNTQDVFDVKTLSDELSITSCAVVGIPPCISSITINDTKLNYTVFNDKVFLAYIRVLLNNKYTASIPIRVVSEFVIKHPDGRSLKYDISDNTLRLNSGSELPLAIYDNISVFNSKQGRIALSADCGFVRHICNVVKVDHVFMANCVDFAWYLRKTGEIYNDYAGGCSIGYDAKQDALCIVPKNSPLIIKWVFTNTLPTKYLF